MEVTIKVPDKLAAEARAHGVSVEVYVREILARQALETTGEQRLQSVRAAIDRILDLRKGNNLACLRTKDPIHEGQKYGCPFSLWTPQRPWPGVSRMKPAVGPT